MYGWTRLSSRRTNQHIERSLKKLNAVAIVALDKDSRICLVHQYRHPFREYFWEIPAGRLDMAGEKPVETAKRELLGEARPAADNCGLLTTMTSSAGFAPEWIHVFVFGGQCRGVAREFSALD